MTKKDLKFGMVVEIETNGETNLAMVTRSKSSDVCISGTKHWYPLSCVSDDLTYDNDIITKVYDVANYNDCAYKLSTKDRILLWERTTTKEMTLEEIEKKLGFKVELVDTAVKHEFKVGDTVRIRQWDDMEKEFGLDCEGDINCDGGFLIEMKNLCGRKCTIKDIFDNIVKLDFEDRTGDICWQYTTHMIEHI